MTCIGKIEWRKKTVKIVLNLQYFNPFWFNLYSAYQNCLAFIYILAMLKNANNERNLFINLKQHWKDLFFWTQCPDYLAFIVDFQLGSKYTSVIGRNLLPHWLNLTSKNKPIGCSCHSVIWCYASCDRKK